MVVLKTRNDAAKTVENRNPYTRKYTQGQLDHIKAINPHEGQMSEPCFMSSLPAWGKYRSKSHRIHPGKPGRTLHTKQADTFSGKSGWNQETDG